mmetsp:Transcript_114804/g.263529  ORF Transcript_114804/g.263529 Transcript_114804/m.263529 type:complete len:232 (-) Transcript_114804:592-1287(-)
MLVLGTDCQGDGKITQHGDRPIITQHDVGRLDVAVEQLSGMHGVHSRSDLAEIQPGLLLVYFLSFLLCLFQQALQVPPINEIHDEIDCNRIADAAEETFAYLHHCRSQGCQHFINPDFSQSLQLLLFVHASNEHLLQRPHPAVLLLMHFENGPVTSLANSITHIVIGEHRSGTIYLDKETLLIQQRSVLCEDDCWIPVVTHLGRYRATTVGSGRTVSCATVARAVALGARA